MYFPFKMSVFYYSKNPERSFIVGENTLKYTPHTFEKNGNIWELEQINNFFSLLSEDISYNVVDIGAQSGSYTLYSKFLPKSKFYAFEPFNTTFDLLNENIKLNNITNTEIFKLALSNISGEQKLKVCKNHNGLHTLGDNPLRFSEYDEIVVKTTTIDEMFYDKNIKVDFIKIDTEGYEYFILKGGENTLKKDKPIIQLEWNETNMKQCNLSPQMLIDFFSSLNYVLTKFGPEEMLASPIKLRGDSL